MTSENTITQAEAEHKALVNECIVNVMIAHQEIPQAVKDAILRDGLLMADRYTPPSDVSDDQIDGLFTKQYLVKEGTNQGRENSLMMTMHRYAEQGNHLTQRYLRECAAIDQEYGSSWGVEYNVSGLRKLKKEKFIPLMMGVTKGFLSRPKVTGFFLNPSAEAILNHCVSSRKVWTTSDPTFDYKLNRLSVGNPVVHTGDTWAKLVASAPDKVVVYSMCPSADEDTVNVAYCVL